MLERFEPLLQQGRGNPRHAPANVVETGAAGQQLANDQQGPALRQYL
jgi:hypothetical protein